MYYAILHIETDDDFSFTTLLGTWKGRALIPGKSPAECLHKTKTLCRSIQLTTTDADATRQQNIQNFLAQITTRLGIETDRRKKLSGLGFLTIDHGNWSMRYFLLAEDQVFNI